MTLAWYFWILFAVAWIFAITFWVKSSNISQKWLRITYVICGIIADEISIGVANTKTTAVRVIPAWGKKPGDVVSFGGLLGYAPVMKLNDMSPAAFIARGGRIPAPIHSLKN